MPHADLGQLTAGLRERRDAVARRWRAALVPSGYVPLAAHEVLEHLGQLVDQTMDVLAGEPFEPLAARAIGTELAELGYVLPQVLGSSLRVLGQELTADIAADDLSTLQPRLIAVLSELATGFTQAGRESILAQQETIRRALLTQREEAERALRESEARFRAIFQDAPFGIGVADLRGRILTANPALEKILGYSQDEMQGRVLLAELTHAEDAEAGMRAFQALAAGECDEYQIEQRFFNREGRHMWVHLAMSLVRDAEGRPVFAIGMGEDVTARKVAEEQRLQLHREQAARAEAEAGQRGLAFLAEASTQLAASLDYATTIEAVVRAVVPPLADWATLRTLDDNGNLRPVATAHIDPRQEALALQMRRRYPPQAEEPLSPAMAVLRSGESVLIPEVSPELLRQVSRGAEHFAMWQTLGPQSLLIVPLTAHGRVHGTLTLIATAASGRRYTTTDLALAEDLGRRAALAVENAQLYARAQTAIQTAEEAVRARDEFLSVAAHELKTPVTSLRGFAQLSLRALAHDEELDRQRLASALTIVNEQSSKLSRLVTQLLNISRIQSGKLVLEARDTDVALLVADVTRSLAGQSPHHTFTTHTPDQLWLQVDPLRLEQVLVNLLDNAIKYSPDGGPIEVDVSTPEPTALRLSVRDQGIGIPAEHRDRIFERFYQVGATSQQTGMGLGLYISRQIVELHGGRIEVETPPDGGARFVVTLPIQSTVRPRGHVVTAHEDGGR
jgi:PAS domain S-box-containing protein